MTMVKIARPNGLPLRVVRAKVFGLLCIHRTPSSTGGFFQGKYTITHIPTGFAVKSLISKREALRLVKKLQQFDWNFKRAKTALRLRDQVEPIIFPKRPRPVTAEAVAR